MTAPARAGAAGRPRRLHDAEANTATSRPDEAAALPERLAAVEAGIRADRHRLPAAVVEEIARLWAAGATVSGIAARTGVSTHIVRDRLRRAGALEYLFRNRHRHVQEVLERRGAELIAAYLAGATVAALAARAGVSFYTVREYLVAHGIAIRNHRRRARAIFEARGDEMIAAYEAGASMTALAASAGMTPHMIRAYLVARGVAIRDYRGRARAILEARGDELIAAYGAGASMTGLAAGAGVSHITIRAYLVAHGIAIRGLRRRSWEVLERRGAELIAAYEAGATLEALGAEAGVGYRPLRAFLVAGGVALRPKGGGYRKRQNSGG